MNYKPLKQEFVKKKFNFKQIKRVGDIAIYERWKGSEDHHYEVIKIGRANGYTINDKDGKPIVFEPSETYPCDEQWGVQGLTTVDLNVIIFTKS